MILFENNLGENLSRLSRELAEQTYRISGYYSFIVKDPKVRRVDALHYRDRVVQHCVCDEALSNIINPKLVYDNAACRAGKGTHFSMDRLSAFLRAHYRRYGTEGFFLRYDIRRFFDSIDHAVLKEKLRRVIREEALLRLLYHYIDSYHTPGTPGKGIPLGNQTSQWFALYYLDGLNRMIKERFRIKYYTRYMDDAVMLHSDRAYLKECLSAMTAYASAELKLSFNEKTQIFPLCCGVDYLGFHFYLTATGKVVRRLRQKNKRRYKRKLRLLKLRYENETITADEIRQSLGSHHAHLSHGHTWMLRTRALKGFVLTGGER